MGTKLYVGNLNYRTTEESLKAAFVAMGLDPQSVQVIKDHESGRSRGFAFVQMASDEQAARALELMQGRDVDGRLLNVTEARERGPVGGASQGPRMGPRIGPPVNQGSRGPQSQRPPYQGGNDAPFRPARPHQDFGRSSFAPRHIEPQPHPDLLDPQAAKDGRNRDSRRERREYRGSKQHDRDDDDDY